MPLVVRLSYESTRPVGGLVTEGVSGVEPLWALPDTLDVVRVVPLRVRGHGLAAEVDLTIGRADARVVLAAGHGVG